ncbi:phage tail tube protein [Salinispora vitiensis]|uniref:phage tail tube protein n=1 Tax=Salinispora vitiensis TaxID=999544 RepID=UPI0003814882|nr:hypothetical protein [Salinispora vitiensis]
MATRQINARDLIFEVSDMDAVPTWTGVGGLLSGTVSYNENEEFADTTVWDSEGYYGQEKMQLGASLSLEGRFLQDPATGVRDPGQELVEAHAVLLGYDSQIDVRFRYPGSTTWKVWKATVSVGEQGGGLNDKASWNAEFVRCGAPSTEAVV